MLVCALPAYLCATTASHAYSRAQFIVTSLWWCVAVVMPPLSSFLLPLFVEPTTTNWIGIFSFELFLAVAMPFFLSVARNWPVTQLLTQNETFDSPCVENGLLQRVSDATPTLFPLLLAVFFYVLQSTALQLFFLPCNDFHLLPSSHQSDDLRTGIGAGAIVVSALLYVAFVISLWLPSVGWLEKTSVFVGKFLAPILSVLFVSMTFCQSTTDDNPFCQSKETAASLIVLPTSSTDCIWTTDALVIRCFSLISLSICASMACASVSINKLPKADHLSALPLPDNFPSTRHNDLIVSFIPVFASVCATLLRIGAAVNLPERVLLCVLLMISSFGCAGTAILSVLSIRASFASGCDAVLLPDKLLQLSLTEIPSPGVEALRPPTAISPPILKMKARSGSPSETVLPHTRTFSRTERSLKALVFFNHVCADLHIASRSIVLAVFFFTGAIANALSSDRMTDANRLISSPTEAVLIILIPGFVGFFIAVVATVLVFRYGKGEVKAYLSAPDAGEGHDPFGFASPSRGLAGAEDSSPVERPKRRLRVIARAMPDASHRGIASDTDNDEIDVILRSDGEQKIDSVSPLRDASPQTLSFGGEQLSSAREGPLSSDEDDDIVMIRRRHSVGGEPRSEPVADPTLLPADPSSSKQRYSGRSPRLSTPQPNNTNTLLSTDDPPSSLDNPPTLLKSDGDEEGGEDPDSQTEGHVAAPSEWAAGEQEDPALYRIAGGYHATTAGERFGKNGRYEALTKLGWGEYSIVWLAVDHGSLGTHIGKRYVALKISKAGSAFRRAAQNELALLKRIDERCRKITKHAPDREDSGDDDGEESIGDCAIAAVFDAFDHGGPNGNHFVMVLELCGPNLLALISAREFHGLPLCVVKVITKEILRGLATLHEDAGIMHTDLKPENILLAMPSVSAIETILSYQEANVAIPKDFSADSVAAARAILSTEIEGLSCAEIMKLFAVKIADLGTGKIIPSSQAEVKPVTPNTASSSSFDKPLIIQTREYRCPEVVMGTTLATLTASMDIWSLGCIVFELLTGCFLFDPKAFEEDNMFTGPNAQPFDMDSFHLSLIIQMAGPAPNYLVERAMRSELWMKKMTKSATGSKVAHGYVFRGVKLRKVSIRERLAEFHDRFEGDKQHAEAEIDKFVDFLEMCLKFDPKNRGSAKQLLQSEWLK